MKIVTVLSIKGKKKINIYISHELCARSRGIGETLFTAGINEREREGER